MKVQGLYIQALNVDVDGSRLQDWRFEEGSMLRFNIQGSSGGACSNLLILFIQETPLKNGSSPESSPFLGTLVVRVYVFNHVMLNVVIYVICVTFWEKFRLKIVASVQRGKNQTRALDWTFSNQRYFSRSLGYCRYCY